MTAPDSGRFAGVNLPAALRPARGAPALSVHACREMDARLIETIGLPGVALMENAASALAHAALSMLDVVGARGALVLAGPGNNGGDGFALHRRLLVRGVRCVTALLFDRDRARGDARINLGALEALGGRVISATSNTAGALDGAWADLGARGLIVDAIFGAGLNRPPAGCTADAVGWLNATRDAGPCDAAVLAVDLPTGLDGDTGRPVSGADPGAIAKADLTVTLGTMKAGLAHDHARRWAGRVLVGGLGAPLD
ncbi:MAG: NAD(P)H-hydrate epimerase [Planctomycetota bacterium]|nr:MAG: NAD(P)H-hydrate epimerase [Planctomycetota bacterium]